LDHVAVVAGARPCANFRLATHLTLTCIGDRLTFSTPVAAPPQTDRPNEKDLIMLSERLARIKDGANKRIPPDKRAIMHRATDDLRASGIMDGVIKVGDPLPAFALKNSNGQEVRSSDLLAKGPLVLTVFRGSW
jgi:hypothetical protein